MKGNNENKKQCPVCGHYTLDAEFPHDICSICRWEDDSVQLKDPTFRGGANSLSLNEYREKWRRERGVAS